ncbi:MAG: hypothetical protein ABEK01_04705 [Candidatus Nanohaloarchaea archaeon]
MGLIEKYGTVFVALLIGGGFAFGGIASFSGLVNTGNPQSPSGGQGKKVTMPSERYSTEPYNLTYSAQSQLAVVNNVAFVNGLYATEEGKSRLAELKGVTDRFDPQVYMNLANYTEYSVMVTEANVTAYPAIVVVGSNSAAPTQVLPTENLTETALDSTVCKGLATVRNGLSYCMD